MGHFLPPRPQVLFGHIQSNKSTDESFLLTVFPCFIFPTPHYNRVGHFVFVRCYKFVDTAILTLLDPSSSHGRIMVFSQRRKRNAFRFLTAKRQRIRDSDRLSDVHIYLYTVQTQAEEERSRPALRADVTYRETAQGAEPGKESHVGVRWSTHSAY